VSRSVSGSGTPNNPPSVASILPPRNGIWMLGFEHVPTDITTLKAIISATEIVEHKQLNVISRYFHRTYSTHAHSQMARKSRASHSWLNHYFLDGVSRVQYLRRSRRSQPSHQLSQNHLQKQGKSVPSGFNAHSIQRAYEMQLAPIALLFPGPGADSR
jgi:hypothetical protein